MGAKGKAAPAGSPSEGQGSQRAERGGFPIARVSVLGLAFLIALQQQLMGFLFPASAAPIVSPLFFGTAAAALLLVYCYGSYRKDAATFSTRWSIALSVAATVSATVAGGLVAAGAISGATVYFAAVIIGFSMAALTYAWATIYAQLTAFEALRAATVSLLIAGALEFVGMQAVAYVSAWIPIGVFALGACGCFVASIDRNRPAPAAAKRKRARPVRYLPTNMKEHAKLCCGVALYALALGVVAGTTAANSTESNMGTLNADANLLHLATGCVLVAAVFILGKRVNLAQFIRAYTPIIVVVFLLNIVIPHYSNVLLACTFFAWTILQVFAFLLTAHIARQGIASLSLAFPIVWSMVLCGNAAGILIGQIYVAAYGNEQQAVFIMAVALTVIVVAASSLLLGNANVVLATARQAQNADEPDCMRSSSEVPDSAANHESNIPVQAAAPATAAPEPTPLETACDALARTHNLSEREAEVFKLLARGYTRTSIAKKLFVSENTVRVHVKNVYAKLYVHSKQQLIDLVESKAGTT